MTHLDELVSFILSDELKEVRNYNCYDRLVVEAKMLQQKQVKNIAYEPVLAVVHRKNEYGEICYCKDNETNCDLCRFSGIPMKGNSVCEKCYSRLKSNEYYR